MGECGMVDDLESDGEVEEEDVIEVSKIRAILGDLVSEFLFFKKKISMFHS